MSFLFGYWPSLTIVTLNAFTFVFKTLKPNINLRTPHKVFPTHFLKLFKRVPACPAKFLPQSNKNSLIHFSDMMNATIGRNDRTLCPETHNKKENNESYNTDAGKTIFFHTSDLDTVQMNINFN